MGWRFRRSIGRGPFRLNFSKRGVGYSWGIPGIRVTTTADGNRYLWLSIPGTGLAWSKRLGVKGRPARTTPPPKAPRPPRQSGPSGQGATSTRPIIDVSDRDNQSQS